MQPWGTAISQPWQTVRVVPVSKTSAVPGEGNLQFGFT